MSNQSFACRQVTLFNFCTLFTLVLFFSNPTTTSAQQVAEVITDFGGFWKSGVGTINPAYPNTSHNVLSFKYNSVVYSTGVDDSKLTANSISYTSGDFRAFPVATVGGTVTGGSSIFIALASRYDGIPNGYSSPLPSLRIKDVLIDGIQGLDIGTGATNIPASALINFPINTVITSSISDAKPDIVVSQIAQPTSIGDTLYFINSSGVVVGSKLAINWTSISSMGTWYLDLFSLPSGALCDTARISGAFDKETTREIRMIAFKLSDFGITAGNASLVTGFVLKASGSSDPAFIAYNADAFTIPAPVITVHPLTQVVCPNASNSVTFTVSATGGSLTYQWRKNNVDIAGANGSSYTIANVVTASAGTYTVVVTNPVGSVVSNPAYLNISISVQPSPAAQLIATGAGCTLSVSANNATGYQWRKAGADISGATSATYTISSVNYVDTSSYSVRIINPASSGCANITSNVVVITGSTTLYSKNGVNLNLPSAWGVASDGTGSSPVDFTRAEHTFVVKNNASTGGNLNIAGTLDVANAVTTISSNTTLNVKKIIRSGTGSIAGSGTASLTVRDTSTLFFRSGNDSLKNLQVDAGYISLISPLAIVAGSSPGILILNGGTFNTGSNLTLKSNAGGTARLAALSGGAAIIGNVTVERYIPSARGWRLLSVPISSAGAPTINTAWQEGATTASPVPNPNPGYGGQITGGTVANGYDQSTTNFPSIKVFDSIANRFIALPSNPGTNIPISNYPAYFLYLRGDRGINLMQGLNAAITPATLRVKGQLQTGNKPVNIRASGYTLVGNPYPAAVDFATLTRSNVSNTFYLWDPKMAGNYGLGGYVTVSYNSATGLYDKTTSVSPVNQYIQSGEAFMIASSDLTNPGTLTFKETDKTLLGSDQVYRSTEVGKQLRINMLAADSTGTSNSLLDGVLVTYDDANQDIVDGDDAKKLYGSNQSINLKRDGQMLAIERRKNIALKDTCFLNLYQMKPQPYNLEITAENMGDDNVIAVLKDNYEAATNNYPLSLQETTTVPFTVNANPASYAVNRFSVVFERLVVLPVTFTAVNASKLNKDVVVSWQTEQEEGIKNYFVEASLNAVDFIRVAEVASKGLSSGKAQYTFLERNVTTAIHYYRIVSVANDASEKYSPIVKVDCRAETKANSLVVFPNPVKNNLVALQCPDLIKGNYSILLFDMKGQQLHKVIVQHPGGIFKYSFKLNPLFPAGEYQLRLSAGEVSLQTALIVDKN